MNRRLEGQVAIVTGAGQGIGQGIALALAKDGAAVAIVGRTESKIVDTCELIHQGGGRAIPVVCDVTDVAQIDLCVTTVVQSLGGLDILINNAQVSPHGPIAETTDATMYEALESGPIAAFRFMRTGFPHLLKRPGVVINMGSGAQMINEGMNYRFGPYLIAKYAMLALTRQAAVEWGVNGIRTFLVTPSAWTPMSREGYERHPEVFDRLIKTTPLGRMGDAETDLGGPICWLCTKEAGYMTGTTIQLDGGQMFMH